jgi:hypothetical protein
VEEGFLFKNKICYKLAIEHGFPEKSGDKEDRKK